MEDRSLDGEARSTLRQGRSSFPIAAEIRLRDVFRPLRVSGSSPAAPGARTLAVPFGLRTLPQGKK
jgi:hypothetical protein